MMDFLLMVGGDFMVLSWLLRVCWLGSIAVLDVSVLLQDSGVIVAEVWWLGSTAVLGVSVLLWDSGINMAGL